MEEKQVNEFINQIKIESTYKKFINNDIIYQLIAIFNKNKNTLKKQDYPHKINNPLELALNFYKEYNIKYYDIIIKNIKSKKIIISKDNGKSFTDTKNNTTFIRLYNNDSDLFIIVHELAHFIDRNNIPQIIPDKYWFLSETFAFYIEKNLENWLLKKNYKELILIRKNNRLYYEYSMIKAIENELYYENLYRKNNKIEKKDININKIKSIKKYNISSDIVNYLLQYPLANIISDYLINNCIIQKDTEIVNKCLNADLYKILKEYVN